MKVFNKDYGYLTEFDCVIKGTILVSEDEWKDIKKRIKKHVFFLDDLERFYEDKHGNKHFNIRTTGTQRLFKAYKLEGYRMQNYQIRVKKSK